MRDVLVVGAGNIGQAIARLMLRTGDYSVCVADNQPNRLGRMPEAARTLLLDASDPDALREALEPVQTVISAGPYYVNRGIAQAALDTGTDYFDLTEDVETTRAIREIADGASHVFVPQCGLAPGFVSIAAFALAQRFEALKRVKMRVGALPLFPSNALKYNLTWSTAGLINEYCNPCEVIYDGELREVMPLEGYEQFSLDGVSYEAFNTSGGLGTLCETLAGQVENLNYKTIRYPGHCELMKFLCQDLKLANRRELFLDVLEHAVPVTAQDVVLIFVTVSGQRDGQLTQETYTRKVYHSEVDGKPMAAIQLTTAAAVCAMVDLHAEGKVPRTGFVRQEDASLEDFMANRFGRLYESKP